jgi:siroheme synthase (precorrin-2 oxidase/ferrochelatase)
MTNTFSTPRAAVKISSFYPFAINLKDRKVLVLGGGDQAYREILRLIDAGAILTIVSVDASDSIRELLVTHASRATLFPFSASDFLASLEDGSTESCATAADSAETKGRVVNSKATESKATESKAIESKATESKAAESKAADSKVADSKVANVKAASTDESCPKGTVSNKIGAKEIAGQEIGAALADFELAFLLSEQDPENNLLSQRLSACGVPCHFLYQPEKSEFVTASPLKRGHLKIAVSTDGLCQPLERAISRRIEELFVYDFDHYSLFLSALEEKLTGLKDKNETKWIKLNQRLEGEDFYLAIARKNFEEALRMVDNFMAAIERGDGDVDNTGESEINRPRNSSKGGL